MVTDSKVIRETLLEIATQFDKEGPGFAQEGVVMREAKDRLQPRGLDDEEAILDEWQKLFQSGQLIWGYNLDNPGRPWYHLPSTPRK